MRGTIFCLSFFVAGWFVAECFSDDAVIAQSIQASLSRAKGNGVARDFQLEYVVENGRVTVAGRCGNSSTMRHLVNLMRYTPGVVRVENEIQVTQTSPTLTPLAPTSPPKRGFEKQPMIVRIPTQGSAQPEPQAKSFQYADESVGELPPVVSAEITDEVQPKRVASRPVRFPSFAERRQAETRQGVVQPAEAPAQLPPIVESKSPQHDRPVQFRSGRQVTTQAPQPVAVATLPQNYRTPESHRSVENRLSPPQPPADVQQEQRNLAPAPPADQMVQPASVSRKELPKTEYSPTPRPSLQPAPEITLTDSRDEIKAAPVQSMKTAASDWIASTPQTAFEQPARETEQLVAALASQPSRSTLAIPPQPLPVASDVDDVAVDNVQQPGFLGVSDWSQIGWIMISFAAGVFVVTKLLRAKRS